MKIMLTLVAPLVLAGELFSGFQKNALDMPNPIIDNLVHQSGTGYTLFLNRPDTTFYLLQFTTSVTVPSSKSFVSFRDNVLSIRDLSTSTIITYSLNSNIYGIGFYEGTVPTQLLTTNSTNGITLDIDPGDIESLSCKCHANAVTAACEHGGVGSNGCEVTDGGGAGTLNWNNHCSVSCNTGYYACCNE